MLPQFRMCKNEFPAVDDLVFVEIVSLNDNGATCRLLEYADRDCFLGINDWSRKRIKSVNFTKVGTRHVVHIIRVDEDKNYIDVARKHVTPEEIEKHSEVFKKSCIVYNMFQRVSQVTSVPIETLYEHIGWPLTLVYPHVHDAFMASVRNPSLMDPYLESLKLISVDAASTLVEIIAHRMKSIQVKVCGKVKVMCHSEEGIEAIKKSIMSAKIATQSDNFPLDIVVEACPIYCIYTRSYDEAGAREAVKNCMSAIKEAISAQPGGVFEIYQDAKVLEKGVDAAI